MKVCCTGDFHGLGLPEIPDCDLLLVAGDIGLTAYGNVDGFRLARWLHGLHERKIEVVAVAGNHDYNDAELAEHAWTLLDNEAAVVRGLKVWGSPMSVTFGSWAHMTSDEALHNIWSDIPDDVEIILVHGPPFGYGDYAQRRVHTGSKTLFDRCKQLDSLKLVVCGHIHESYGIYRVPSAPMTRDIRFTVVNGSWVDASYRPGNAPIVVEL